MPDRSDEREAALHAELALDLRTIVVTSRIALREKLTPADRDRAMTAVTGLLADLERRVLSDGADPGLLAAIHDARESLLT